MSETKKYKFNLEELKKLNLPDGNYSIAIRAKNSSKKASLFSKLIEYIIESDSGLEQLTAPTITLSDVILQIADNSSGLATSFDILVDGEVVANVKNEVEEEASKLPAPTLFYADGELTIADYSGYSTNYTLNIFNKTSNGSTAHGGGSN